MENLKEKKNHINVIVEGVFFITFISIINISLAQLGGPKKICPSLAIGPFKETKPSILGLLILWVELGTLT